MTKNNDSCEQKGEPFFGKRRARANAVSVLPYFDGTKSYELDYDSDGHLILLDGLDEDARIRDLEKKLSCNLSRIECIFDEITLKNTAHMLTRAEKLMTDMKQLHEEYKYRVG